ncbi:exported hypothetical protein [Candidatus Magnetomoraceae bacterium gMMP-13]
MKRIHRVIVFLLILCLPATVLADGKIVVNHDEWPLSNEGFHYAPDAAQFVLNIATWFTNGSLGKFLVYSSNFGATGSSLSSTMTNAGHSWTINTSEEFTLSNLLTFDGIFFSLNNGDNSVLIDYVRAGGNVYVAGGSGDLQKWNPFLNEFGLEFEAGHNNLIGNFSINSSHPIFTNVKKLYFNHGNSVNTLNSSDLNTEILWSENDNGLVAIYDDLDDSKPPEWCIQLVDEHNSLSITYSEIVNEYEQLSTTIAQKNQVIDELNEKINNMFTKEQMENMVADILEWGDCDKDGKVTLQEIIKKLMIMSGVISDDFK